MKGFSSPHHLCLSIKVEKMGLLVFVFSKIISTAPYCFTSKNLRRPFILEQVPCSHKACSTNRKIKIAVLTLLTKLINTVNPDKVTRFQNSDFQPKPPPLPKEKEMKRFQTLQKAEHPCQFSKILALWGHRTRLHRDQRCTGGAQSYSLAGFGTAN